MKHTVAYCKAEDPAGRLYPWNDSSLVSGAAPKRVAARLWVV
jgi:hypothetical protein